MTKTSEKTRKLVLLALFAAIIVVLASTPLGMIPLVVIKATTLHIPVILGAILMGPAAGAVLGGVFGICSMVSNTMSPNLSSFAFSPFMSTTGVPGAIKAIWIAVGCRILIGVVAGWLWRGLSKTRMPRAASLAVTGFVGSLSNTIFVMGSIYVLLGAQYAQAQKVAQEALFGVIMSLVGLNGVPEAAVAAVLVTAIGMALLRVWKPAAQKAKR